MLSSVIFLQVFPAGAQNVRQTLSGRVTDAYDEPLAGANVFVKGDIYNGTSTDAEGRFVLQLPNGRKNIVIEASFIGMKPYSMDYEGQKEIIIIMQEDSNMMEGAVVTGKQNINDLDIRAKAGVINMVDVNRLHDKPVVDMSLSSRIRTRTDCHQQGRSWNQA